MERVPWMAREGARRKVGRATGQRTFQPRFSQPSSKLCEGRTPELLYIAAPRRRPSGMSLGQDQIRSGGHGGSRSWTLCRALR
jgi:hypothetical protein